MNEDAFILRVAELWRRIVRRPDYYGGDAFVSERYYPWPVKKVVYLSGGPLTRDELVYFAEEVLKLEGLRMEKPRRHVRYGSN